MWLGCMGGFIWWGGGGAWGAVRRVLVGSPGPGAVRGAVSGPAWVLAGGGVWGVNYVGLPEA